MRIESSELPNPEGKYPSEVILLAEQMKEGIKLDKEIKKNLEGIGFKVE